jgi:hypothetical protein
MLYLHDTEKFICWFHFPYSTAMQHDYLPWMSDSDLFSKAFNTSAF